MSTKTEALAVLLRVRQSLAWPLTAARDYALRRSSSKGRGHYVRHPLRRGSAPDTSAFTLNKLCEIEDWDNADRVTSMRSLLPYMSEVHPGFPENMQHRKHWEFAQLMCGLERLGVLTPDAMILSVGAGHEEPVYALTNAVRWVFATDTYGLGKFRAGEGDSRMLVDPDAFARFPYTRERLVVQWMNGLDLRYEPGTFDSCFSMSSIEHFGGLGAARAALGQMSRVTKPGGVVAITTECIVNDAPYYEGRGLALFTPGQIEQLSNGMPELSLVEPLDLQISSITLSKVTLVADAVRDGRRGSIDYPSIVMEHKGREFTSVSLFYRKERN